MAALPTGQAPLLRQAIAEYQQRMLPLKRQEPAHDGSLTRSVADAFAPIGAKMRPDMSVEQGGFWASSIVLALSDLPAFIAKEALEEAVHTPWKFPTDMEEGVRGIAEKRLSKHQTALHRLQLILDAISRAGNAQPRLEAPPPIPEPMSMDELRAILKGPAARSLVRMGLACGQIRQADLDAIEAESRPQ